MTRAQVSARLAAFSPLPLAVGEGARRAAVAVALVDAGAGLGVWVTRRAPRMRAHAGQWALPGGSLDGDEDAERATVRELHEELGVRVDSGAVLGRLDDYATRSGFVITPVVVWIGSRAEPVERNPAEVASVHLVSLDELDVEPRFITIPESDRPVIQMPVLRSLVHAPTGAVLYQFREVVLHGRATRVADYEQPVFAWR